MRVLLLGLVLAAASPASALDLTLGDYRLQGPLLAWAEYDVIELKDGTVLVGTILRESEAGITFKDGEGNTRLIKYEEVDGIKKTGETPMSSPAPAPTPTPAAAPAPDPRRKQLALERDRLVDEKGEISMVSPGLLMLAGGIVVAVALVSFTGVERTAYAATGALIFVLGAGSAIIKVSRRSALDRKIKDINHELKTTAQQLPPGHEVMVAYVVRW